VEAGLERFTDLYDFAPVGYLNLGRDGVVRQANLTGSRLLRVERARLQGRRLGVFVSESDRAGFQAFLEKAFASQATEVCEVMLRKEREGLLNVQLTATAAPDGQECRVVIADITARKQAEEALRESQTRLQKANEELEQKVKERTADLKARVDELRNANEQLDDKASQLKALTKKLTIAEQAERKRLSQVLHEGDLADGLEWLGRWMRDKNHFDVDLAIETRPMMNGDAKVLVFESVRELLFNVVRHARVSRARVSIEQADAGRVRIAVSDEGCGFDPCQLKLAGEEGGFGLFSIRERIGLISGVLEIESASGKGSRFTLVVPVLQKPTVPLSANCSASMVDNCKENENSEPGAAIRILLADDHALFRAGVARMLKKEPDLKVIGQAKDGREAIDLAGELKPDVILMDISMPNVNGIEATRVIHRKYPGICVIGLSMYEDHERGQTMRDAGASDYKSKGCAPSELISAIRECTLRQ